MRAMLDNTDMHTFNHKLRVSHAEPVEGGYAETVTMHV